MFRTASSNETSDAVAASRIESVVMWWSSPYLSFGFPHPQSRHIVDSPSYGLGRIHVRMTRPVITQTLSTLHAMRTDGQRCELRSAMPLRSPLTRPRLSHNPPRLRVLQVKGVAMLAYTAGDSLQAITRTFGIGRKASTTGRMEPATQNTPRISATGLLAFYGRTVRRVLSPNRS